MSEYDAGWLPPRCPECREWETVRYVNCGCLLTPANGEECGACGGNGGWFLCSCGFTDKPEVPPSPAERRTETP